ncbi:hypothetical protein BKA70DRAFT_1200984 [Coprinopsis sp. MPI-PUGE-AT-0042]|nr:hypothetical protein BKA70DRAFT_1200984 [Coprinopsis sp. MPI-PUGE-AT-0042]
MPPFMIQLYSNDMADPPPTRGILWFSKFKERLTPISTSRRTRETQSPPVTHIRTAANVVANTINNGNIIMNSNGETLDFTALNDLPTHPDVTGHLSDYFPESREPDMECIMQWINAVEQDQLALCVLGGAGVGKSTLAQHLSEKLRVKAQLAACVFFGFAPSHWGVESVLKLVAGQLARAHPEAVRLIIEAIRFHSGPSVPLDVQIEKFILDPVRQLGLNRPLVIILDALDQWPPHHGIVKALRSLEKHAALIRVVIFGRPGLEASVQKLPNIIVGFHHLLPISTTIMVSYIQDRLNDVPWKFGSKPSPQSIKELAEKAGDLFIWAATISSLLEDEMSYPNPQNTLAAILQSRQTIGDTNILADLYYNAINTRFPETKHKKEVKKFLGALLVLREPIPIPAFASLTSINPSVVARIQLNLGPLHTGPQRDHQQMVYPAASNFHLSFLEYLESAEIPPHIAFPIDISISHFQLGKTCLEELYRFLSTSNRQHAPPQQQYAVKYWHIHTAFGTPSVTPYSDTEWRNTPHYQILGRLSSAQLSEWFKIVSEFENAASATLPNDQSQTQQADYPPDAIPMREIAVRRRPLDPNAWLDLGEAYWAASRTKYSEEFIERAVQAGRYAMEIGQEGNRAYYLLSGALAERYRHTGSKEDLDEAILLGRKALLPTSSEMGTQGHPFGLLGATLEHLSRSPEEAAVLGRAALSHSSTVMDVTEHLFGIFGAAMLESMGSSSPLNAPTERQQSDEPPTDPAERAMSLDQLAVLLYAQFQTTDAPEDLEEPMELYREALQLLPSGHSERYRILTHLSLALYSHFRLTTTTSSLNEAINLSKEVLSIQPTNHPSRAQSLCSLADYLLIQAEITGASETLDEASTLARSALSMLPPDTPGRLSCLTTLAMVLHLRYKLKADAKLLHEAITLYREALSLTQEGASNHSLRLNGLSCALLLRYESQKQVQDLEESILRARDSLELAPYDPGRGAILITLASALRHKPDCLQDALSYSREAVAWMPQEWECQKDLSLVLLACHRQTPSVEYLEEAKFACRTALAHCRPHHRSDLEALAAELSEAYLQISGSSSH